MLDRIARKYPDGIVIDGEEIRIDDGFLSRVYKGPDPEGFKRFLVRAIRDNQSFACSNGPNSIGLAVLHPDQPELGNVAVGHYLAGDWTLLRECLLWAQGKGANCYVYPLNHSNPQYAQLLRVLTKRYHFEPYQHVLIRRFL